MKLDPRPRACMRMCPNKEKIAPEEKATPTKMFASKIRQTLHNFVIKF